MSHTHSPYVLRNYSEDDLSPVCLVDRTVIRSDLSRADRDFLSDFFFSELLREEYRENNRIGRITQNESEGIRSTDRCIAC